MKACIALIIAHTAAQKCTNMKQKNNWVRNDTLKCVNVVVVKELVYPYCFNLRHFTQKSPKNEKALTILEDCRCFFYCSEKVANIAKNAYINITI